MVFLCLSRVYVIADECDYVNMHMFYFIGLYIRVRPHLRKGAVFSITDGVIRYRIACLSVWSGSLT